MREWRGREGLAGLGSVEKNDEKIVYGKRSFQEKKKKRTFQREGTASTEALREETLQKYPCMLRTPELPAMFNPELSGEGNMNISISVFQVEEARAQR